jgi:hypothetical protein
LQVVVHPSYRGKYFAGCAHGAYVNTAGPQIHAQRRWPGYNPAGRLFAALNEALDIASTPQCQPGGFCEG